MINNDNKEMNIKSLLSIPKETLKALIMNEHKDIHLDVSLIIDKTNEYYDLMETNKEHMMILMKYDVMKRGLTAGSFRCLSLANKSELHKYFKNNEHDIELSNDLFLDFVDISEKTAKDLLNHSRKVYTVNDVFLEQFRILKRFFFENQSLKSLNIEDEKAKLLKYLLMNNDESLDIILNYLDSNDVKDIAYVGNLLRRLLGRNNVFDLSINGFKTLKSKKKSAKYVCLLSTILIEMDANTTTTRHQVDVLDDLDYDTLDIIDNVFRNTIKDYDSYAYCSHLLSYMSSNQNHDSIVSIIKNKSVVKGMFKSINEMIKR